MRAAAICIVLASAAATADGTADEADLQFRLGTQEFQRGNFDSALEHFFISNRLAPNANVLFNIGSVYERKKDYVAAHRYYLDAAAGETDPEAIKADRAALVRVTPRVAVLDVRTDPPGATLYVDRKSLGSVGLSPRLLALPPGTYTVIAELAGYEPAQVEGVQAGLGAATPVSLALARIAGSVHV